MELLIQLGFVALLLLVGLVFGRAAEKRHFRDIARREAELADILVFNERTPPPRQYRHAALVVGSVVIAEDYFKRMAAGLKSLVGGRLTAYESLMDRGRREAILRMKDEARARGARLIVFNVRFETASLSEAHGGARPMFSAEFIAYGTALVEERKRLPERRVSYENPQVPHEVNVSRESVPAEFARLALGLGLVVLLAAAVLYLGGGALARLIPYSVEQRWVGDSVLAPVERQCGRRRDGARGIVPAAARRRSGAAHGPAGRDASRRALVGHRRAERIRDARRARRRHPRAVRADAERERAGNGAGARDRSPARPRSDQRCRRHGLARAAARRCSAGTPNSCCRTSPPRCSSAIRGARSSAPTRRRSRAVVARYGHAGGTAAVFEVLAGYAGPLRGATPTLLSTHPADEERIARLQQAAQGWDPHLQPLRPLGGRVDQ